MKNYYVYEEPNKSDLNIPQDDLQILACEIVNASSHYFKDLNDDLIAMEAETTNTSFYILNNISLHFIELTQDGIDLWNDHGRNIHTYLLGNAYEQAYLLDAFKNFSYELSHFDALCEESIVFKQLGLNMTHIIENDLDKCFGNDQYEFTQTVEKYYKIKKIKSAINF